MNAAFALTVLTGLDLFFYDPIDIGLHTTFLPKLVLIALGLVHAYGVERTPLMKRQSLRRLSAGFALLIWIAVMGASTWNESGHQTPPMCIPEIRSKPRARAGGRWPSLANDNQSQIERRDE